MIFQPMKVVDIELSQPITDLTGLQGYGGVQVLARLHGSPLGYVNLPLSHGVCLATDLTKAILEKHSWMIMRHLLADKLVASLQPGDLRLNDLLHTRHPAYRGALPTVTVAVCTRDRTEDLARCLESLLRLDYPVLELLVIDNAPKTEATEQLVRKYPAVRYVREPRPGLDWARNRAALEAQGEIVAYTDDDVVVDPQWVKALALVFAEHPEVMAVTGFIAPYELETEAQTLFEWGYGGFGRGFTRRWHRTNDGGRSIAAGYGGAGQFGTGANMAYRRSIFGHLGLFDPALDVGTVTNGGGDLEMFFRVLKAGHVLVYEPDAMVWHRHRREYGQLRNQLSNNGIGLCAYFVRNGLAYPNERRAFARFGLWWLYYWHVGRLRKSLRYEERFPRDLIWAEFKGAIVGLRRYQQARAIAKEIREKFGPLPELEAEESYTSPIISNASSAIAVRTVDVSKPLQALTDVTGYYLVRLFITRAGRLLGCMDIYNSYQPISVSRLRESISSLVMELLESDYALGKSLLWSEVQALLTRHCLPNAEKKETKVVHSLPHNVPVSIVIGTYDRPDDLRNCLTHLLAQQSSRPLEIIVVDNHPSSNLTPPVVAEFPTVKFVSETRQGSSYARNAGFLICTGDIVVTTDDDVTAPPDWLEKLIAPFVREDVMLVTGNVLPLELETEAQRRFESYGGLGRGFVPFEVNRDWYESFQHGAVTTWELGATANAAFRAEIMHNPEIGLLEESLGAGMPTGTGEDIYLFYKIVKAGYTLAYAADAYVWHKHRRTPEALRRQIYSYSKGHVAYHLTTFAKDRDLRSLRQIVKSLPKWRARQLFRWLKGRLRGGSPYPLRLILLEIAGNLAGPWALWRSRRRVKRTGRSASTPPPVIQELVAASVEAEASSYPKRQVS